MKLCNERENTMEDGIRDMTMTIPYHWVPDAIPSTTLTSAL